MKKVFFLILVLILAPACTASVNPAATAEPTPILEQTNTSAPMPTLTKAPPTPTSTFEVPTATPLPSPEPTRTPSVEKLRDLPYIMGGSSRQVLDIYLPTSPGGPFPTILTAHGGGGDKTSFSKFAMRFVQLGYAVVSINYREPPADIYPAAVQDTFCALAWMHANASAYNLDMERFFALGHSSGGTLVAMLGTVDDPMLFLESCPHPFPETSGMQGVVTFTGIFDYVRASANSTALQTYTNSYLGAKQDAAPEIWAEASPVSWVDGNEPPFLVIHGEADRNIHPDQSANFAETMEAAKVDVHLLLIPDLDHGGIVASEIALEAVEIFLEALPPTPTATETVQPTPTVPSETVHFTTSDGVDLVGTLFGEGDIAVILTHMSAVGISRTSWFPFARHIARQGFTALAFDFRGWGASSGIPARMGEPKDILAAVELLQELGYERIICMGASMGGIGCLKTAMDVPGTFEALGILAAPFPEGEYSNLTLPKVFVFTEQDYAGRDGGFDQIYQALPEPKEMVILPGQAHGTDIFNTLEADQLTDTLSGFLDSLR